MKVAGVETAAAGWVASVWADAGAGPAMTESQAASPIDSKAGKETGRRRPAPDLQRNHIAELNRVRCIRSPHNTVGRLAT